MLLDDVAHGVVGAYLEAVDAEAPGLVEGLYLTGSAALGDFRAHTSDIDYVAVTAERPDTAATAALARAHRRLRGRWRRPSFDGVYVTWNDLAQDPTRRNLGPHSHEGRLRTDRNGPGDPVTWHTLARYGITCRGPDPADLDIWCDQEVLAAWTIGNLDGYWRRLLDHAARLRSPWGLAALTPYAAVWVVTGVSRMHYTLATGDLTSKEGAGRYALQTFGQRWHRVVDESLRIRRADQARPGIAEAVAAQVREMVHRWAADQRRSLYPSPMARRRDVLAFAEMVITDARRLHDGRPSGQPG